MQARSHWVGPAIALALILHGSSAAQGGDQAQSAFHTSLAATVVPVVLGTAMILAADAEGDQAVAGYAIATLGLSTGPALGHWQLGNNQKGWVGAGGRLLLTVGSLALAASAMGDCDFWTCSSDLYEDAGLILLVGHAAAALWALRDISSLGGFTLWRPTRRGPQVRVAPGFTLAKRAPALVVSGRF